MPDGLADDDTLQRVRDYCLDEQVADTNVEAMRRRDDAAAEYMRGYNDALKAVLLVLDGKEPD